jgi:hypothetical protein
VLSASEPDGTLRQEPRTVIYERSKVAEASPVEPRPGAAARGAGPLGRGDWRGKPREPGDPTAALLGARW